MIPELWVGWLALRRSRDEWDGTTRVRDMMVHDKGL